MTEPWGSGSLPFWKTLSTGLCVEGRGGDGDRYWTVTCQP